MAKTKNVTRANVTYECIVHYDYKRKNEVVKKETITRELIYYDYDCINVLMKTHKQRITKRDQISFTLKSIDVIYERDFSVLYDD